MLALPPPQLAEPDVTASSMLQRESGRSSEQSTSAAGKCRLQYLLLRAHIINYPAGHMHAEEAGRALCCFWEVVYCMHPSDRRTLALQMAAGSEGGASGEDEQGARKGGGGKVSGFLRKMNPLKRAGERQRGPAEGEHFADLVPEVHARAGSEVK